MLVNMKEILSVANEKSFAVPAFNIGTCQILKAVVECCEEKKAPVILAIHPKELAFQGDSAMAAMRDAAEKAKVPVCIHMDHSSTVEEILHAVDAINGDYARHSTAARRIAREYFNYDVVLKPILSELGV